MMRQSYPPSPSLSRINKHHTLTCCCYLALLLLVTKTSNAFTIQSAVQLQPNSIITSSSSRIFATKEDEQFQLPEITNDDEQDGNIDINIDFQMDKYDICFSQK